MPVRYAIHVEFDGKPGNRPEHLHGLISGWLDPRDRHTQNRKPWALAPLEKVGDSLWRFEVGVLDGDTEGRLVDAVSACPPVLLGGVAGRIARQAGDGAFEVVRSASWAELARGATLPRVRDLGAEVPHRYGRRLHAHGCLWRCPRR